MLIIGPVLRKEESNIVCLSWYFLNFWKYLYIMIAIHVLHSEYSHKSWKR